MGARGPVTGSKDTGCVSGENTEAILANQSWWIETVRAQILDISRGERTGRSLAGGRSTGAVPAAKIYEFPCRVRSAEENEDAARVDERNTRFLLGFQIAVALGGCGIWLAWRLMHFSLPLH